MARKAKEFDKNGIFQTRFKALFYDTMMTQEELAEALEVTRPTAVAWLDGKSLPDILSLEKIARLFDVSADYLLGLSNTKSPDVSVQAATAYTGLSQEAVEMLHIGLDDFECDGVGISETERKNNLEMASTLIQSTAFTGMIHNLYAAFIAAYSEHIMTILQERHSEESLPEGYSPEDDTCEDDIIFEFAKDEDRAIVMENLIHTLNIDPHRPPTSDTRKEIENLDDEELISFVVRALLEFREENELRQFHAAKAFSGYIDHVVKGAQTKAEERFSDKPM